MIYLHLQLPQAIRKPFAMLYIFLCKLWAPSFGGVDGTLVLVEVIRKSGLEDDLRAIFFSGTYFPFANT